jgi:2-polyprenyl-3-methyl-5-hydroxy-6-metoxy-1,4-benzoquinol methylase
VSGERIGEREDEMDEHETRDIADLNREAEAIWNQNADFWDERMGDGNQFQLMLTGPASERLLDLHPGERVLEIACGNGVFTRRMAQLGAHVVASDFSDRLLERARARSSDLADRIEYRRIDATSADQLLALGKRRFDAAVCNMALMDMATIEPLMSALSQLLKAAGRFVFSVTHPCFNTTGVKLVAEEEDREGQLVTTYSVSVSKYLGLGTTKGLAMAGQPAPQYYFNRPLSLLFNTCFRTGFVLDALEEPAFDDSAQPSRPLSWINFREIPPVLVARMRLTQSVLVSSRWGA